MSRRTILAAGLLLASARIGGAQLPRRIAAPAGAVTLPSIPADAAFPFAGTWVGYREVEGDHLPVAFAIEVTKGRYSSVMILPDNTHVPLVRTRLAGDTLIWESPNSGGGVWVYKARRAAADTVTGTVVLHDAPENFGPKPPSGKFLVVRQPTGAGGR